MFRMINNSIKSQHYRSLKRITYAIPNSPILLDSITTVTNHNRSRQMSSFSDSYLSQFKLNSLKSAAMQGDEKSTYEYIKTLSKTNPKAALAMIEKGWNDKSLPVSELYFKEYLKIISSNNAIESININALMRLLANKKDTIGETNPSFLNISSQFSAGSNPSSPLYITNTPPSARESILNVIKKTLGLFLILAFLGSMFDDKSSGGMGGIASRISGIGSATHQAEHSDKLFTDVVGIDEAKAELEEIVMYLKDPKQFTRLGGKLPKGVLLTGAPGTGKTLLARAIAGEAGVPFFFASGSEFEEMFVGVGARRVRDLFEAARSKSPSIIFIDEIDAIGGSRHLKEQSSMKMTLNQLLVEMDGFEQNTGIIVIAATNFPETLDNALVRPGRFDKQVFVPMPDIGGRKAILELYGKKVPLGKDVDMEQIARGTPGFSGADLSNLVNQAALKASMDGLRAIGMHELEYAKDKIMMGAERKSAVISPDTMKLTAYHEAGHALVALKTPGADPVHKATIMPRGQSLGHVMQLPDGDQTSMSRKQMLARMDICMAGRVAEEIVFGYENVTSGMIFPENSASSDIQQATKLANAMVKKCGLSDKVGMMFIDDKEKFSGSTLDAVDTEVKVLLSESYTRAKTLLESHRKELEILAQGLLLHESLSGGELVELLQTGKITKKNGFRSQKPSRELTVIPTRKDSKEENDKKSKLPRPVTTPIPATVPAPSPGSTPATSTLTESNKKRGGLFSSPWTAGTGSTPTMTDPNTMTTANAKKETVSGNTKNMSSTESNGKAAAAAAASETAPNTASQAPPASPTSSTSSPNPVVRGPPK